MFAITVFIGLAIYRVALNHGVQTLMTVRTMAFLFIGLMLAVLLVGVPFHRLRVWIGKRCFDWPKVPVTSRQVRQITRVSTALLVAQVVVSCYATKLGYQGYFS